MNNKLFINLMETLPNELFLNGIFKYLINIDMINFKRVNRNFYFLIKEYLRLEKEKLRIKNENLKVKAIRHCFQPEPFSKIKWHRFFKHDDGYYFNNTSTIYNYKRKEQFIFNAFRISSIKIYNNKLYIANFSSRIYVYNANDLRFILFLINDPDVKVIVDFEIKNNKIYFCNSSFKSVDCWSLDNEFIKRYNVRYCPSNMVFNEEGNIMLVTFDKQVSAIFYEEKEGKKLAEYNFRKYGKILTVKNSFNYFYVALDIGNVSVFDKDRYLYFVKTNFQQLTNIIPIGNIFYAIGKFSKKIKICGKRKIINVIDLKILPNIKDITIDNGNPVVLYSSLEPLI